MVVIYRRGCAGELEHREGGRGWPDHWLRKDTQQVTGVGSELGLAQGAQQDRVECLRGRGRCEGSKSFCQEGAGVCVAVL